MLQATVGQPDLTGALWSRPGPQLGQRVQLRLHMHMNMKHTSGANPYASTCAPRRKETSARYPCRELCTGVAWNLRRLLTKTPSRRHFESKRTSKTGSTSKIGSRNGFVRFGNYSPPASRGESRGCGGARLTRRNGRPRERNPSLQRHLCP